MTTLILLWSAAVLASSTSREPDGRNQGSIPKSYLMEMSDIDEAPHCVDSEGNRRDKGEKWKEGCNTCVCSRFSLTHGRVGECTRRDGCGDPRQCVDSRGNLREPGEKWKKPGDCNTCTCGRGFEPGTYSCTLIGCQIPRECVDSEGKRRDVGEEYQDGCWTCVCTKFGPSCYHTDGCGPQSTCVDSEGNKRDVWEKWMEGCKECVCGRFYPEVADCREKRPCSKLGRPCLDEQNVKRKHKESWLKGPPTKPVRHEVADIQLVWLTNLSLEIRLKNGGTELIVLKRPDAEDPCYFFGKVLKDEDSDVIVNGCEGDKEGISVQIISKRVSNEHFWISEGTTYRTVIGPFAFEIPKCTCNDGKITCKVQDDSIPVPDWPRQVQKEQEQVGW